MQQSPLYDYILTNIDTEETTNNLISIITAEHSRKEWYKPSSPDFKNLMNDKVNN